MSLKFPISLAGKRGGGGVPAPLHWWDLDSLSTGIDDQGTSPWNRLQVRGSTPPPIISVGPNGQDVVNFTSNGQYLHYSNQGITNVAWDGVSDTEMSQSFWFRVTSVSSQSNRMLVWRSSGGQPLITQTFISNSSPDYARSMYWDESLQQSNAADETETTQLATWYHLVSTLKDGVCKLYLNNQLIATDTNPSFTTLSRTAVPFSLATASWNKGNTQFQHKGQMGMVGIWDTALTEDSINHLYNDGLGRQYADLPAM